MSLSDLIFVFDIKVQELLSYIECKEFYVRCQFADIFNVLLKDPNEINTILPKKKKKLKQKVREIPKIKKPLDKRKTSQTIIFESGINSLIECMKSFPIELSLWGKDDPDNKIGSTSIPWSPVYYEYLNRVTEKDDLHPAFVNGGYNVFDETTSKRMAIVRLSIKLTCIKDNTSAYIQALFEDKQKSLPYTGLNVKNTSLLSTRQQDKTGVIKTSYSGGKQKNQQPRKSKKKIESNDQKPLDINSGDSKNYFTNEKDNNVDTVCLKVNKSRSDTVLDNTKLFEVKRSISQCILNNQDRFNMLNYIYGSDGPFESKVYCVGYFTVENDNSRTPSLKSEKDQTSPKESNPSLKSEKTQTHSSPGDPSSQNTQTHSPGVLSPVKSQTQSSPGVLSPSHKSDKVLTSKSHDSKGKYKIRICNSGCLSKKHGEVTCSQSQCSLDLPEAAAEFITVKKCTHIDCDQRQFNEPPSPPDDRVLLDLTHLYNHECKHKKVEEISGKVNAKQSIEMTEGSCFCTCECTFGFVKKTTFCTVCGGFEKVGEDFSTTSPNASFPCPIYHKITKSKSPRPEKIDDRDSKKKKKKRDDRFKFNYGYTAPHIGHSQCAMPCTGTMGPVPKNMGWLWTAENIPGMKVAQGWKPGAIEKHLLRKLNKAKIYQSTKNCTTRTRRTKKQVVDKPTLIVCKRNGEYIVEMQATSENDNCEPLIYKIVKENNSDKIRARAKKEKRLIKEAMEEVWSDPYHPEACDAVCYKAYQQTLGIFPGDPYFEERRPETVRLTDYSSSPSESCSSDEVSTDSSLDFDWELHFTPPINCIDDSEPEPDTMKL